MKLYLNAVVAFLLISCLFYSCEGDDGLCYANLDFEITQNDNCELGEYIGFQLLFVDDAGKEMLNNYVIPAAVQSHVIALAPNHSYEVFIRSNGVQNNCTGPVHFDIVVSDPDSNDECFRTSQIIDARPGLFTTPIASFTLGETCDNCPPFEAGI